jgi:hypothetical protein
MYPLEPVMIGHRALSCVVVLSLLHVPMFGAEILFTEVIVRVYDNTGATEAERRPSLKVAASIVSAASVELVWRICNEPARPAASPSPRRQAACDRPLAYRELAVRIVRSGVVQDGTRKELPLGDAMIDMQTGTGVLATVYIDRVNWMAQHAGVDAHALLGRAIAHELGHLLMATGAHGPNGLMRPVWLPSEIRRRQIDDWIFRPHEIAAIRARTVIGRGRVSGPSWTASAEERQPVASVQSEARLGSPSANRSCHP